MRASIVLWSLLCSATSTYGSLLPNVKATFNAVPRPFNIEVDPDFIEGLRQRVSATRLPKEPQDLLSPGADGPPIANATTVRDFWVKDYDWDAVQADINRRYAFSCRLPEGLVLI